MCTRERAETKWNFYKLTYVTIFAALLKQVPMGGKDTLTPDALPKNASIKNLIFEQYVRKPIKNNFCLLRSEAFYLRRIERLEQETSKLFNLFIGKTGGTDLENFGGVCKEDIAAVEDIVQADVFLYNYDIVDGYMIGELA